MKTLDVKPVVFFSIVLFISLTVSSSQNSITTSLIASDGTVVTINRDYFGVPHIVAESEVGVFFGQGFAAAQDRLYQMESSRRSAEGKLAEVNGNSSLNLDKDTRSMYYTKNELGQIFNDLPDDMKIMLESYRDGVNTYLDSMAINPARYKPLQFAEIDMEPWTVNKSIAISQQIFRWFGQVGGNELANLNELQKNGQEWFDLHRPINDPTAPTTIPDEGAAANVQWKYSGISVREEIIESIMNRRQQLESDAKMLGLPEKFGSFSVLISPGKSNSGSTMLLGCPQMGDPGKSVPQINNEVELKCPTLHVAGMSIAGIPSVIIGHNEDHAWTLTTGYSDNCDVYIDSTFDNSYSKYFHNGEWLDFEVIQDTIISAGVEHDYTHYRTIHGPVIGDDLENHQVFSLKMTFWKQELAMNRFLLGLARATTLGEFETAAALNPMTFNLLYAGKDQNIKFWHTGKYQDRNDGVDPRLPHKGDGSEEWNGFIPFSELPAAENPSQNYFVNWNNKPVSWWNNGDNIPWVGDHRVTLVDEYVGPIDNFTFENLKSTPIELNAHGTYQQAIEFVNSDIIDENIVPPGQSGFIDLNGQKSIHFDDQWQLHKFWQFKDQLFNYQQDGTLYPRIIFDDATLNLKTIYSNSAPLDITANVKNIGDKTDTISVSIDYEKADSSALTVSPVLFGLAAGDSQVITFTINPSLLDVGQYNNKLILDAKYCPSGFHYEKSVRFKIELPSNIPNDTNELPIQYSLEPNYPNPFNANTTIKYALKTEVKVSLIIYDLLGREIKILVNKRQKPGWHETHFRSEGLPSGLYFYKISAGDFTKIRKMMLIQ